MKTTLKSTAESLGNLVDAKPKPAPAPASLTMPARDLLGMIHKVRSARRASNPTGRFVALAFQKSGYVQATSFDYLVGMEVTYGKFDFSGETHRRLVEDSFLAVALHELIKGAGKDLEVTLNWETFNGVDQLYVQGEGYRLAVPSSHASGGFDDFHYRILAMGLENRVLETTQIHDLVVDVEAFKQLISSVLHAVGKDGTLPILASVQLVITQDRITAFATDRYRLARAWMPISAGFEGKFLLRHEYWKRIAPVLKGAEMTLQFHLDTAYDSEDRLTISGEGYRTVIMGLSGSYPKINELFSYEGKLHGTISAAELKRAVRVIGALTPRNTPFTITGSEDGKSVVISGQIEDGQELLSPPISAQGAERLVIAFNPTFYGQAIRAINSEKIRISFTPIDPNDPINKRGVQTKPVGVTDGLIPLENVQLDQLVMPVRMPNGL